MLTEEILNNVVDTLEEDETAYATICSLWVKEFERKEKVSSVVIHNKASLQ